MAYISNDSYWGFDVELAMAVCERLGWTLKMQPIEKENVYIELSSGNIDCAWGGIALDQADVDARKFTQYGPYVHNDIVIATRSGSSGGTSCASAGGTWRCAPRREAMAALETDQRLKKAAGADNAPRRRHDGVL